MTALTRTGIIGLCLLLFTGCITPADEDGLTPPPSEPPPAPPAGPPGTPSATLANECQSPQAGWIWCDDFDQDRLASYYGYVNASGRFTRVAGVGTEGSHGMRSVFATTPQTTSGSLMLGFGKVPQASFRPVDGGTEKYREIYWRLYVRYPSTWVGGGGDKLSRATSFVSPDNWSQAMIAHVWSGGSAPYNEHLYIDPASGTDEAGNVITTTYNDFDHLRWLTAAKGATPLFSSDSLGRWYCVEAHARLNDAGQANGLFELWVNGRLDAQRSGLNWVGAYDEYGINAVLVENYWNNGSPVVQERYLDNFVVSTRRIGCPA
jgi:hypothetical protein